MLIRAFVVKKAVFVVTEKLDYTQSSKVQKGSRLQIRYHDEMKPVLNRNKTCIKPK